MPLIKLYKFREIEECNMFLAGAIFGGALSAREDGQQGFAGIVGKKLQFTKPVAVTCTFVVGTLSGFLLFSELKAQLEAVITGLRVMQFGGRICFIESTPTNGVVLKGPVAGSCNDVFGFDMARDTSGVVYGSPYGDTPTPPYWMTGYSVNDNLHVIHTFE